MDLDLRSEEENRTTFHEEIRRHRNNHFNAKMTKSFSPPIQCWRSAFERGEKARNRQESDSLTAKQIHQKTEKS
jgi:hypothetical protein